MRGVCELCGLEGDLTKHHLVPQVVCRNKYKKSKNDESNFAWICRTCHDQVHALYSEHELRDRLNTVAKLKEDEKIASFLSWRRLHPEFKGSSKMSNNLKKRR